MSTRYAGAPSSALLTHPEAKAQARTLAHRTKGREMIDRDVERIVDDAVAEKLATRDDLLFLMRFAANSPEAAYVRWGSDAIGRKAAHGIGKIYAQIGLDATPCPENCAFCTLSARNSKMKGRAEVPDEDIVDYARVFSDAGVHLISLMATAAYDFDHFLQVARSVRGAVSPDMPIMANIGDITLDQAKQLKDAGVQVFYHANRLGEGRITGIPPARRVATIDAVRNAGLSLMSAVEPVYKGVSDEEIAGKMLEVIDLQPICAGVGVLTAVPGTAMGNAEPISRRRDMFLASIMRLAAGTSIPNGCGCGNAIWTDAGTNPRGRNLSTNPDFLRRDVKRLRKQLIRDEWIVPDRPLPLGSF